MKTSLLLLLFFLSQFCFAQNIVPNYSFEQYDTCPDNENQIQRASGWSKYSYLGSTPDYYNGCDTGGFFGIPSVAFHHGAHAGNAFAGVVTYQPNFIYREHIGIQLTQPLIIGQKYFISFYTTMGYNPNSPTLTPSNNIGIRLSTVAYNTSNPSPMDNFAHLYSVPIITDTVNWVHVSGSIIADSAYNYCIIGNFFDKANTDTIQWNSFANVSYYGVDDICVSTDSLTCNPLLENIKENIFNDGITLFPNPTSGTLTVSFQNFRDAEVSIYDGLGRKVFSSTARNQNSLTLNLGAFAPGCYVLQLVSEKDGKAVMRKLIKL